MSSTPNVSNLEFMTVRSEESTLNPAFEVQRVDSVTVVVEESSAEKR